MTDKVQLIKEEIKNLKTKVDDESSYSNGWKQALRSIEIFIDSLPEESDCEKKDYRERYEKLTQSDTFKSSYCDKSLGKEESTDEANCITKSDDLEEAASKYVREDFHERSRADFIAGARWQRNQDQETIELAEDHAMLAGMNKMKEEMMKDAVEGEVRKGYVGNQIVVSSKDGSAKYVAFDASYADAFCVGDKVKIIIVKTEQQ